ncbi:MAG: Trk system potassium transporter TrkA [Clostridia bacterium]|nr:Trk system potassium transporter TrkA [Clostridia bacterium]
MYIIVVGLGKMGTTLTAQLAKEGHDVVAIDTKNSVIANTVDTYDVMGICGSGSSIEVLGEAGAKKAKLIIACTDSDELNILCCTFAKSLGTEHTIARVRNPDYANQVNFLREKIGINMIVNPEYETANEIARIIRFPSVANVDSFARGKVEIARIIVHAENPLCDMPIHEISKKFRQQVLICAVQRGSTVTIPSGDFIIKKEDSISITGTRTELTSFMRAIGVYKQRINNVMIVGGGRIGYYLSLLLSETSRNIKLIDLDEEKCRKLKNSLGDVTVICGDGTDQDLLDELSIENQDSLVALTGIDEENIIVSMYAYSKNVKKVITKVDRHSYSILTDIGLETIVSPQLVAGSLVTRYVRALQNSAENAQIHTLYKLVGGKVEALEFSVPIDASYENIPFKDLHIFSDILIVSIIRKGKIIFPGGDDVMKGGDTVIVVTAGRIIEDLHDIFI